jgi:hypothetical protein
MRYQIIYQQDLRTSYRIRKSISGSKLKSVKTDSNPQNNPFQWVFAVSLRFISRQLRKP